MDWLASGVFERSVPMAAYATVDTSTEEWCFLCGPWPFLYTG
jgi:hypothetical protein